MFFQNNKIQRTLKLKVIRSVGPAVWALQFKFSAFFDDIQIQNDQKKIQTQCKFTTFVVLTARLGNSSKLHLQTPQPKAKIILSSDHVMHN